MRDVDTDGDGLTDHEEHVFGTNPNLPMTFPGIPDTWLAANFPSAQGFDPNGDPDGDGINNAMENQLGLDPHHFDKIGPVNFGFDEEITDSPDMSFRDDYPSDLYDQTSIPGWNVDSDGNTEGWQAGTGQHIEIWDEDDGNPYAELQSQLGAHGLKQEFNVLPGSRYFFILRYKGRYEYDAYDNAFDLEVEVASELLVDGSPATAQGSTRRHSFMDDDDWDAYADWHYATVSITAETGGTGLKKITLVLVPKTTTTHGENGEEEITYGGFVDLVPVDIDDNVFATGVDDVSIMANFQDIGSQGKLWIMAPSGNDPNGNACSNAMKFKIPFSATTELEISYPQGAQAPATATPSTVTLGAAGVDCSWHGESATTTETPAVEWKIGASGQTKTAIELPVAVKTMKRRTVKVAVYPVKCKVGDYDVPMPSEDELTQALNSAFAYQVNAWFDVDIKPQETDDYDENNDRTLTRGTLDHVQLLNRFKDPAVDITIILVSQVNYWTQLSAGIMGQIYGSAETGSFQVVVNTAFMVDEVADGIPVKVAYGIPVPTVLATVTHEVGHLVLGEGHPDQDGPGQNPGAAPLKGTDRTKRLMYSEGESGTCGNLLVKAEWDKAEVWLSSRPNGDN